MTVTITPLSELGRNIPTVNKHLEILVQKETSN